MIIYQTGNLKLFSENIFSNFNSSLYSKNFLKEDKNFKDYASKLAKVNNNVLIINFEDLFTNKNIIINQIIKFLNIENNDILYRSTLFSNTLETKEIKFLNEIKDDPYRVLSNNQINFINYLYDSKKLTLYNRFLYRFYNFIINIVMGVRKLIRKKLP